MVTVIGLSLDIMEKGINEMYQERLRPDFKPTDLVGIPP